MEAPDHQVGAHFEALDKDVLVAALNLTGYLLNISISSEVRCIGILWIRGKAIFVAFPNSSAGPHLCKMSASILE